MPLTEGIVAGLIANALTEVVRFVLSADRGSDRPAVAVALHGDKELENMLRKAVAAVAKDIRLQDPRTTEQLQMFLISPDAETVVRHVYSLQIGNTRKVGSDRELRDEFTSLMSLYLGVDPVEIEEVAGELFSTIVSACDLMLKKAVSAGVLLAHDAKSERRHRALLEELAGIERKLELLRSPERPNVEEIVAFEDKYRKQLVARHGHITPPHFDVAHKLPIKDICVPARLVREPANREAQPAVFEFEEFRSDFYRSVILGNPGGGKSTLACKLCFDLASEYRKRHLGDRQFTPILVVLRDYGSAKKLGHVSIVQYIAMIANANYQVAPPEHAFEYMLVNGRVAVIFDGLDELLDTSYRQEISDDIECFSGLYPSVPILVTSREVGYEQAPLDREQFEVFRLAPFDDKQVELYVQKWFAADKDLSAEQQRPKVAAFLQESRIVADLRSNPLMLALMCNIYRGENYIPRNRPDVYEKCAVMLFEKWDKGRGILVPLPFEAHISPAMKFLAHWIYSEESLQGGVSEQRLVAQAADYLCQWRYEDRAEAEKAARDFIEFCTGRAWVFTDTGTTPSGERLFQFTHRTFLEYFTASHLVRTNPTPELLTDALLQRIARREWDVVAQLAYQLQNKQVEGAGDKLLMQLVRAADSDRNPSLLSFAARCLEFIVPSPRVVRDIARACVEAAVFAVTEGARSTLEAPAAVVGGLLLATDENFGPLSDAIEKSTVATLINDCEARTLAAIQLAGRLAWAIVDTQSEIYGPAYQKWWPVMKKMIEAGADRIRGLSVTRFVAASVGYDYEIVSLEEIIRWYGASGLFREFRYALFPNTFVPPIASRLAARLLVGQGPEAQLKNELAQCGSLLLSAALPWCELTPMSYFVSDLLSEPSYRSPKQMDLSGDSAFGALAIWAGLLTSINSEPESRRAFASIRAHSFPFFERTRSILLAPFDRKVRDQGLVQIEQFGFTVAQKAFLTAWMDGAVTLGRVNETPAS